MYLTGDRKQVSQINSQSIGTHKDYRRRHKEGKKSLFEFVEFEY